MNRMQDQVEDFHRKFGQPLVSESERNGPRIRRPDLRASLIAEESKETCDAIEAGDLIAAIDGLCDLIYVALGTASEFGIDLEPFFDEVHRSNMAKVGGTTREDGKILKPEGWQPPDIAGVFARVTNTGSPIMARCPRCEGWTMFHAHGNSATAREWSAICHKAGDTIVQMASTKLPHGCMDAERDADRRTCTAPDRRVA